MARVRIKSGCVSDAVNCVSGDRLLGNGVCLGLVLTLLGTHNKMPFKTIETLVPEQQKPEKSNARIISSTLGRHQGGSYLSAMYCISTPTLRSYFLYETSKQNSTCGLCRIANQAYFCSLTITCASLPIALVYAPSINRSGLVVYLGGGLRPAVDCNRLMIVIALRCGPKQLLFYIAHQMRAYLKEPHTCFYHCTANPVITTFFTLKFQPICMSKTESIISIFLSIFIAVSVNQSPDDQQNLLDVYQIIVFQTSRI